MRETLRETVTVLNQAANMVLKHSEMLAQHSEMMPSTTRRWSRSTSASTALGRHLEVLSDVSDGLIRDKADRKKR